MERSVVQRPINLAGALALAIMLAAAPSRGQEADAAHSEATPGHSHEKAERHGGEVAMTRDHHFETVWKPDGVRIYIYTQAQAPASVGKAAGTVTFKMEEGSSKEVALAVEKPVEGESPTVYFCPMHPEVVQMEPGICTKCGAMKLFRQDRLFATIDLAGAKPGSVKAFVTLNGLKGSEKAASFVSTFTPAATPHEHDAHEGAGHSHH